MDSESLARFGLLALAATIPLQRATVVGALGSLASILAIVVIPVALWAAWKSGTRRGLLANPLLFAVALTWWAGATTFWSAAPAVTSSSFFRLLSVIAMAVAFLCLSHTSAFRLRLLNAYVLGSVAAGALVVWQYATAPGAQRVSLNPDASINQVAFTLVLALVPAAYLLARELRSDATGFSRWRLFGYGASYSIIAIGVLLSGSRSGAILSILATVVAVTLVVAAARTPLHAVQGLVAMLVLGIALVSTLSLTEAPPVERIMTQQGDGIAEEARADLLARAWRMSAERPLVGAGLGTGVSVEAPGLPHVTRNPHNTHAQVFLELGAVGATLWALLLLGVFRAAWTRPPRERLMWVAQLVIILVGVAVRGFVFGVPMWFFLALAAALAYGHVGPSPSTEKEWEPT